MSSASSASLGGTMSHTGILSKKQNISRVEPNMVKFGYLYVKRPPCLTKFRIRAWQKKFFILRDISFEDGISTLEMFSSEEQFQSAPHNPEYTLDLKNVTHIQSHGLSKRFPHAILVVLRGQRPLIFGSVCPIEKRSWFEALSALADKRKLVYQYKDIYLAGKKLEQRRPSLPSHLSSQLDSFHLMSASDMDLSQKLVPTQSSGPPPPPRELSVSSRNDSLDFIYRKCNGVLVKVVPTPATRRIHLEGEFYMNILPDQVTLTSVAGLKEVISWLLKYLADFKCDQMSSGEQVFKMEANKLCSPNDGSFHFKTKNGNQLLKLISEARHHNSVSTSDSVIIPLISHKTNKSPAFSKDFQNRTAIKSTNGDVLSRKSCFLSDRKFSNVSAGSGSVFYGGEDSAGPFDNSAGSCRSECTSNGTRRLDGGYLDMLNDEDTNDHLDQNIAISYKELYHHHRRDSGYDEDTGNTTTPPTLPPRTFKQKK